MLLLFMFEPISQLLFGLNICIYFYDSNISEEKKEKFTDKTTASVC